MAPRTLTRLAAIFLLAGCSAQPTETSPGPAPSAPASGASTAAPQRSPNTLGPGRASGTTSDPAPDVTPTPGTGPATSSLAPTPTSFPLPFPAEPLAEIREGPLPADLTATLQSVLDDVAASRGTVATATVLSAGGTWSGAAGTTADGTPATPDVQMELGAITKTVVAAQVMALVERGLVELERPAARYLPKLPIDPGDVTVRELLGHRSTILDYTGPVGVDAAARRPGDAWETTEILALLPEPPEPIRSATYSPTDYLLLGLLVEEVTGQPLDQALREDVLEAPELARLVVQPAERPAGPVALSVRRSHPAALHEEGGRYLPSLRDASYAGAAEGMAGDAPSTARFMHLLCGGHLVSRTSLTEMATTDGPVPWGLGFTDVTKSVGPPAVGSFGQSWYHFATALCLPEQGAVLVLLTNDPYAPAVDGAVPRMVEALRAG
ncbi:CubicO group peptidase (beta-lactamase class C family) [Georgenia muralis]|uniref:CubicO group peptidase (Beta-lactamase class C family) n=1 Tax=Georgenia muralis TaxID=154117 RepID=A0A3N4Z4I3_9MICO|nr:CubicO group peptidase (beta-lactamase class C family) [Georgenia muralis]